METNRRFFIGMLASLVGWKAKAKPKPTGNPVWELYELVLRQGRRIDELDMESFRNAAKHSEFPMFPPPRVSWAASRTCLRYDGPLTPVRVTATKEPFPVEVFDSIGTPVASLVTKEVRILGSRVSVESEGCWHKFDQPRYFVKIPAQPIRPLA